MKNNKTYTVAPNHLNQVETMLKRCINLLDPGRDILPYAQWRDKLQSIVDSMYDHASINED